MTKAMAGGGSMIIFENEGIIDPLTIKTFGVSVKESDSPIGYFGTGLKYAIAVALRHGCTIDLYTDGEHHTFKARRVTVRGQPFDLVVMGPHELGFTTDLGRDWEPWMAFREFYCNMLDERGEFTHNATPLTTDELRKMSRGRTLFVVGGKAFDEVAKDLSRYFLPSETPKMRGSNVEIYDYIPATHRGVFYRGVRVGDLQSPSAFTLNLTGDIKLTEDRTFKYASEPRWALQAYCQSECHDKDFLVQVLCAPDTQFEGAIDWGGYCGTSHSDFFLDTIEELRLEQKDVGINGTAVAVHATKRQNSMLPKESIGLNQIEQKQLDKAHKFCQSALGIDTSLYPLIVVEDLGGHYGRANIQTKTMYISRKAFAKGTKMVAATLLEEWTHIHHKVLDETPEQKWVYLEMILGLGELLSGEPL